MHCTKAKVYGWHLVAPPAPKAETSKPKHGLKWTELTFQSPNSAIKLAAGCAFLALWVGVN